MDETLRFFLEVRDKNPGAFRRYQTEARTAFQNVQREIDTSARSADRLDR